MGVMGNIASVRCVGGAMKSASSAGTVRKELMGEL
jgi:hypothetical protein